MANTITDVMLGNTVYQDVYAETGIAVGTAIFIQNKGSVATKVQIKSSQPAASSSDGVLIQPYEFFQVDAGESGVWAKGSGRLCVQKMGA